VAARRGIIFRLDGVLGSTRKRHVLEEVAALPLVSLISLNSLLP